MPSLVLGPLLRHVDSTTATIWVETESASTVTVEAGDRHATARTFAVHGHHYALVELTGLAPGSRTPYAVRVDDETVWPSSDPAFAEFPPSVIATLDPGKPLRMAFGSCRVSVDHDAAGTKKFGVDAMRAYALYMAGITENDSDDPEERWPDLAL